MSPKKMKESAAMEPLSDKAKEAAKDGKTDHDEHERETWGGSLDFLMSALSFAVGMGNMWRFPYLCYRNGGGAFLIPYIVMVVVAGLPMMFLEFAFGQYGRLGIVSIWKVIPLFQGIGWSMFLLSVFTAIYYNMLNAWCIFYIAASFAKDVPWRNCGNEWNTADCGDSEVIKTQYNCTKYNGTFYNFTCYTEGSVGISRYQEILNIANTTESVEIKSPSDEYFHNYMLSLRPDVVDMGPVRWQLALCLLLVWLLVAVCLSRGIKSSGKATYVTALFPYVILIILFVRGVTLDGAKEGILFYITPQWDKLLSFRVWVDAAVQVFFSLSACWGGLITLASFNSVKNNCMRDAIVVAFGDMLTSIFGGVVVFSFIGYMAYILQIDIDKVATDGAGLAFIVYPQAVTTLPISPLWAILFMIMLINVGIGTQFTLVTTLHSTLLDVFHKTLRPGRRPLFLLLGICLLLYILGLPLCTGSGVYVLQLMDNYSATYTLLFLGICECCALSYVYGIRRFSNDIKAMLDRPTSKYWWGVWMVLTPAVLLVVLVFTLIGFKRTSYGHYTLPVYCDVIGSIMALSEILLVPGIAIYKVMTTETHLPIIERIKYLCRPAEDWGLPAKRELQKIKEQDGILLKPMGDELNHV